MASRAGEAAGCPRVGNSVGELVVAVERSEFIGDAEAEGALGEGGVGDALGLFGDREGGLWAGVTWGARVQGQSGAVVRYFSVCP